MKLILTGYARHGKDTACLYLQTKYDLNFVSSSFFVAERAVVPYLRGKGIEYPSLEDCYFDRANNRAKWFTAIKEYNTPDRARLGRELLEQHDIYCGLRSYDEMQALKKEKLYDFSIWIDRSKHVAHEPDSSITIVPYDCDVMLDNNSTLDQLYANIDTLMKQLNARLRATKERACL